MSRGTSAGAVYPTPLELGGTGAQDAEAAREALGIPDAMTAAVDGQAARYTTLAALNAVTSSGSTAIAYVEGDGTNDGSYRANGAGGWTRYSTATISSLNSRTTSLEAAYVTPNEDWPEDNKWIVVAASTTDTTFSILATDLTGPHAGKADFVPHPDAIERTTAAVQAQADDMKVVTDYFVDDLSEDNEEASFGFLVKTEDPNVSYFALGVRKSGPEKGLAFGSFDAATKTALGAGSPPPASLFDDEVVALKRLNLVEWDGEGWPDAYATRGGDGEPTVAVATAQGRPAILETRLGQSLGTAGGSGTPVTAVPPYPRRALVGNTGPTAFLTYPPPVDLSELTDLASAREGWVGVVAGETPVTACMRWGIKREADDLAAAAFTPVAPALRVGMTGAVAGMGLEDISKGASTGIFEQGVIYVAKLVELMRGYGITRIEHPAVGMYHGQQDRLTPIATYKAGLRQLLADWQESMFALTDQRRPIVMFQMQNAACAYGVVDAALSSRAQMELIEDTIATPGTSPIQIMTSTYMLQGAYGNIDTVHMLAAGYAVLAEYEAKSRRILDHAVRLAEREGRDPALLTALDISTCLRPDLSSGVERVGADIFIGLILPADGTEVSIDTTTLPAATNLGFSKSAGTGGSISSVSLVTDQAINGGVYAYAVKVTLSSAGGATLRYAYDLDPTVNGTLTASISDTTLTVTAQAGAPLAVGTGLSASGLAGKTIITALGTGAGGTGTYTVGLSQTFASAPLTSGPTDRSGAWGNFRDNCDEDSIAVPGLKLRNWLITFQLTVA